jgi:hypothetical protein
MWDFVLFFEGTAPGLCYRLVVIFTGMYRILCEIRYTVRLQLGDPVGAETDPSFNHSIIGPVEGDNGIAVSVHLQHDHDHNWV